MDRSEDLKVLTAVPLPQCGIVMPISTAGDYSESHWSDVLAILSSSIDEAGFAPVMVSNADDVGIIQKRIVQNLYDNPIVVCDVSSKNPNVMFELGLRLAFDKPTVIVKDDRTSYSFDTGVIEHLEYPRDLRFANIVNFQSKLTDKIKATALKARTDKNYSTFLRSFGEFKVAKIDQKEVSGQEYIIDELRGLRSSIRRLEASQIGTAPRRTFRSGSGPLDVCLKRMDDLEAKRLASDIRKLPYVARVNFSDVDGHSHLAVELGEDSTENRSNFDRFMAKRNLDFKPRVNNANIDA